MPNKTVLVTGGAQGIGKCITKTFLDNEYFVAVADIDTEAGKELINEMNSRKKLSFMRCNVSNEKDVKRFINASLFLTGTIDVLINNAGIGLFKPLQQLSMKEWNKVLGVNLTGSFLCSKYASIHLKKSKGSIINIASTRAIMSEAGTESYSASKGGIVALTHALSISLGPEVRVNCISPGWIEVSEWKKKSLRKINKHSDVDKLQHPAGRVGKPEDIASMAVYLASEAASFITGQNFVIDGGMTKKMIYV